MKIAIVGAGIFGCTTAIKAACEGHNVHLFELSNGILTGATGCNQLRLHQGYHYPRSLETAKECQAGMASFRAEYGDAIIEAGRQYYAIAHEGSRTSAGDYLRFCEAAQLPSTRAEWCPEFNWDALDLVLSVEEERLDIPSLRVLVSTRLADAGVKMHLNTPANAVLRDHFDRVVLAAYAFNNAVAEGFQTARRAYQYELVEKPVVKLPDGYEDFGCVVMDGPFCSIDPMGRTGWHVLGHVEHAIHCSNVGLLAEVPAWAVGCINSGVIIPPISHAMEMILAAGYFVPAVNDAKYVGSLMTIRAVLPHRDGDDARPTIVEELDDQVIRVFSGKLGTAVTAADEVIQMIGGRDV